MFEPTGSRHKFMVTTRSAGEGKDEAMVGGSQRHTNVNINTGPHLSEPSRPQSNPDGGMNGNESKLQKISTSLAVISMLLQ